MISRPPLFRIALASLSLLRVVPMRDLDGNLTLAADFMILFNPELSLNDPALLTPS